MQHVKTIQENYKDAQDLKAYDVLLSPIVIDKDILDSSLPCVHGCYGSADVWANFSFNGRKMTKHKAYLLAKKMITHEARRFHYRCLRYRALGLLRRCTS